MEKIIKATIGSKNWLEEYIQSLPPSSVNSSREIFRSKVKKWNETHNPKIADWIEETSGVPYDSDDYEIEPDNTQNND